jgi:uncharacterized membrane protein YjdF
LVAEVVEHNQTVSLVGLAAGVDHGQVLGTQGEQAPQGKDMLAETVLLLLMLVLVVGEALVQ